MLCTIRLSYKPSFNKFQGVVLELNWSNDLVQLLHYFAPLFKNDTKWYKEGRLDISCNLRTSYIDCSGTNSKSSLLEVT